MVQALRFVRVKAEATGAGQCRTGRDSCLIVTWKHTAADKVRETARRDVVEMRALGRSLTDADKRMLDRAVRRLDRGCRCTIADPCSHGAHSFPWEVIQWDDIPEEGAVVAQVMVMVPEPEVVNG